jgi:hypothetical protein
MAPCLHRPASRPHRPRRLPVASGHVLSLFARISEILTAGQKAALSLGAETHEGPSTSVGPLPFGCCAEPCRGERAPIACGNA